MSSQDVTRNLSRRGYRLLLRGMRGNVALDLWGRFCDQIYIPGDRDGKMMADLRNVPEHPMSESACKEDIPSKVDYDQGYLFRRYKKVLERE